MMAIPNGVAERTLTCTSPDGRYFIRQRAAHKDALKDFT